jgi:putative redox protein
MATDEQIRTALERTRRAIELRPGIALGTMTTSTRLEEGLRCVSRNGDWSFEIDEPSSVGGDNSAPSPGVYGLGALTGCVAMAIKNEAVLSYVSVTSVEVDVEADYDDRGMYHMDGVNGVKPGFQEFRLSIDVESSAPDEKIREIVENALKTDTWFNVFTHKQKVSTDITVTLPQSVEET